MTRSIFWLVGAAPLLSAATAPAGQGLSTPALLMVMTAIVGVVVLRGVLLRRHLRKRKPLARRSRTDDTATSSDTSSGDCGDSGGSCD